MQAPSGFDHVSTTKSNSTRSIATHPRKKRKDGAPSVGMVHAKIVRGGPPADFWNPKVRVPMCLNAAAARSYLLWDLKATDLILAGRTKAQMEETIVAAVDKKELPAMESGAMCYMMSKQGYGGDSAPHWPSHLMFFYSQTDPATWGANLPGSPVMGMTDPRLHLTSFVVAVERWSDGTDAR